MGGYIGTKAVSLSTTSADVTGDADIGGDLTVDTNTLYVESSTNRVGIGTTDPDTQVHIESTAPILSFTDSNSFTDANDRMQVRATSDNMNFQWYDDSAATTTELMTIQSDGKVGLNNSSPDSELHIVGAGSAATKVIIENEASPRGNYIGITGSDNLVISADADNAGADSMIQFHVDGTEHMRLQDSGALTINQTGDYSATNAPPAFIQSVGSSTGTSMMLGRNDTSVNVGNNIGAYLFRTNDSSSEKYGGMVSRGDNTTGDGYVGIYSVDTRLEAGSAPDWYINSSMNVYQRNGSRIIGQNNLTSPITYSTVEDGFYVYHNGNGTNRSQTLMRVRDGTGSDYVWRHMRRDVLKSEIEENGDFMSATQVYGGTSDERLKENIVASGSQWDDIKAVQVKKYSMIEDGLDAPNQLGVIAQDLIASGMNGLVQQHFKVALNPETQEDEPVLDADGNQEEYYTVKYSILYMKAIKALQEAMERIETLETENTAIKTRLDALEAN